MEIDITLDMHEINDTEDLNEFLKTLKDHVLAQLKAKDVVYISGSLNLC